MKMLKISLNRILLPLLFLSVAANAQKLPAKQQKSVLAPANIKIDGKLAEWNGKFEAHNTANRVFYTISNDSENLYLTLKTDDKYSTEKALQGGISFTVAAANNKAKPIEITYHAWGVTDLHDDLILVPYRYSQLVKDSILNRRKIDSVVQVANDIILKNFKEIMVSGIPGLKDASVPIYNAEGIRVAAKLNNRIEYTYELAIPLKLISSLVSSTGLLKYNIKINAQSVKKTPGQFAPPQIRTDDINMMYANNDTGFNGEYTLAK